MKKNTTLERKKSHVTITVTHQRRDKLKLTDTYELKWTLLLERHVAVECINLTWFLALRGNVKTHWRTDEPPCCPNERGHRIYCDDKRAGKRRGDKITPEVKNKTKQKSLILDSTKWRLRCYPNTERERRGRGELEGLKGNSISGAQARRQVSTATGKRRRLPMCPCPLHPTPKQLQPLPSTADKHMWADNMTLPVKRERAGGREREREDQEPP